MANERALGISFIYAAQTWRQLAAIFGEHEARALFGLTNVLVLFGGSEDGACNQEISDLAGQVRVARLTWQTGTMVGRTFSGEDVAIVRPEEASAVATVSSRRPRIVQAVIASASAALAGVTSTSVARSLCAGTRRDFSKPMNRWPADECPGRRVKATAGTGIDARSRPSLVGQSADSTRGEPARCFKDRCAS
jgi:hypothetical protein